MAFDLSNEQQAQLYRSAYYRGYYSLGDLFDTSGLPPDVQEAVKLGYLGGVQRTKPLIAVDLTPPQQATNPTPAPSPGGTDKRLRKPGDNRVKPAQDDTAAIEWYRKGFEGVGDTPPNQTLKGWYLAGVRDRAAKEPARVTGSEPSFPSWAGPVLGVSASLVLAALLYGATRRRRRRGV